MYKMLYYWAIFKDCLKKEKQETRNDELLEMIVDLIELQNEILEYIKNEKVSGVNPEKKRI